MVVLNLLRRQAKLISGINYVQKRYKAKFKDGGEHATFNDFPIPQGSWKAEYDRNQKIFMFSLLSGIAALVGAVTLVATSNKITFNFTIPDYPYEEDDGEEGAEAK